MVTRHQNYDFCILGAGIAGLSLADALQQKGYSVIVIEKDETGAGASGTPGALVNPATGRRATKVWKAEDCYNCIKENLEKVASFSSASFYRTNGLLRPALSSTMYKNMQSQFEDTHWPDGWCYWLDKDEIKQKHPGINCVGGGLWLPIGLTVNTQAYLYHYSRYLRHLRVEINTQCKTDITYRNSSWLVTSNKLNIECQHLVYATGLASVDHPWWFHLPLEAVKGQVATFKSPTPLSFEHSISSLGYIARLDASYEFVQGSTYEHDFSHLNTDVKGGKYLRKRLARTLPDLAEKVEVTEQWAGVRVSTPDKKPVLGRHPEIDNLHIFTALGSKGLMYGKFLADHYARHISTGSPLFDEISTERFSVKI